MSSADAIPIVFVVAVARNRGIGQAGRLLFRLKSDLAHFRSVTKGRPLIMGRKTWNSLPIRPLPGRPNIVLTRNTGFFAPSAFVTGGVGAAVEAGRAMAAQSGGDSVCVIGGAEIYALLLPFADTIWLTEVDADAPGADAFFPALDPVQWREVAACDHPSGPDDEAPFRIRKLERKGTNAR